MIRRLSLSLFSLLLVAAAAAQAKDPETRPFELIVADPAGLPVAGALISIQDAAGVKVELSAAGITDAAGKVTGTFPDAVASYNLDLTKDRFRAQKQTLDLASQKLKKGQMAVIRLTIEPITKEEDYANAVKAIQAKDMAAAEANLRLALATDPQFTKGYEVLAMVQLEQKKFAEGLATAEQALALEPANLSALRSRYDALSGLEKVAEADAALAELAAKDRSPDVARLLYNAGAQAVNAKNPEKASSLFNEALAIDPNLYQAHAALAEMAIADKNYAEAVKELDKVIAIAPRNFKAFERKIEVLKADSKAAEAAEVEKALAALKSTAG